MIAQIEGPREEVYKAVRGLPDVVSVLADMQRGENIYDYEIEAKPGVDIRKPLNKLIMERGWYLLMLQPNMLTLEDVFLKIVTGEHEMRQALTENQEKNVAKVVEANEKIDAAAEELRTVLEGIDAERKAKAEEAEKQNDASEGEENKEGDEK